MKALLSLYNKTGAERFAKQLIDLGYEIISSGGTAKYLAEHGIPVTSVESISGYPAVLGHRVVTLVPQIHGGLLATADMQTELNNLRWPKIDLLYVTFYPLQEELEREGATFESCLEKTDIGGPTMIRSANKGGEVIVMTNVADERRVLDWINQGKPEEKKFIFNLRADAELAVDEYTTLSAEVYQRFKPE